MSANKKSIITFITTSILVAGLVRPASAEWGLGPIGGVNLANADVGGHSSRSITGWAVGGRLEMGLNPLMSLNFEPQLVRTGAEFTPTGGAFGGRGHFVLVELPLLIDAHLSLLNIGVYGFVGPNVLMVTDVNGNLAAQDDLTKNDVKYLGLAGDIGVGAAFGIAPFVEITGDVRYSHGFTDMLEHGLGDVNHWMTRDVRLMLGILLHSPH